MRAARARAADSRERGLLGRCCGAADAAPLRRGAARTRPPPALMAAACPMPQALKEHLLIEGERRELHFYPSARLDGLYPRCTPWHFDRSRARGPLRKWACGLTRRSGRIAACQLRRFVWLNLAKRTVRVSVRRSSYLFGHELEA